ncbi:MULTISPECIES: polysaccharide deacetylase family protein [unclassified Endozoicomonas]|uniref:polysaccharide deacetylase family protein n=2 Tax=Endozoicomonas TaxID=305899 RepID=UPI0021497AB3|nr:MULTISPECIES: polysaccharide deacetylase family protein [unclassified Endozoicomonas]
MNPRIASRIQQISQLASRPLKGLLAAAAFIPSVAMAADSAVFLQYHHVSDKTPAVTSITPEMFRQHLDYLDKNDFNVAPIETIIKAIQSGRSVPDKTVVITFDDAYKNIYENAFPMLRDKGWPFTIFVSTQPVDRGFGNFLTWKQIQEMSRSGATIANHTTSHPHMPEKLPGESDQAWLERSGKEITDTEQRIRNETGQDVKMLAWPFGETAPELRKMIKEMGYIGFGQQSGAIGPLSDFTRLPRFPMSGSYSDMSGFRTKVNSRPLPVTQQEPDTAIIDPKNLTPSLTLTLADGNYQKQQLNCYVSGQGRAELKWLDKEKTRFTTQAKSPLPVGRSRYNCTAPSMDGRHYYWFSHQWLRFTEDGKAID